MQIVQGSYRQCWNCVPKGQAARRRASQKRMARRKFRRAIRQGRSFEQALVSASISRYQVI